MWEIFQSITYQKERRSYNDRKIPVLFIMTSNALEEAYTPEGYGRMISSYENMLSGMVGPTKILVCANTLQVKDYSKYDWTIFDPEAKKAHHEEIFPEEKQKAFLLGREMAHFSDDTPMRWDRRRIENSAAVFSWP